MVKSLCHDNNNIISFTTDKHIIIHDQIIMNNKYQGQKEELEITRVSSSYEPNTMVHQGYMLLSYDEGINKYSKPDHTKQIILVTPEGNFACHVQVIIANMDQGREV